MGVEVQLETACKAMAYKCTFITAPENDVLMYSAALSRQDASPCNLSRYPCPCLLFSCWGEPRHWRDPLTMMPTLEQRASHSAMLCVVSRTDWPERTILCTIPQRNWRARGSTPEVGSSYRMHHTRHHLAPPPHQATLSLTSKTTGGEDTRAMAVDNRRQFPPE